MFKASFFNSLVTFNRISNLLDYLPFCKKTKTEFSKNQNLTIVQKPSTPTIKYSETNLTNFSRKILLLYCLLTSCYTTNFLNYRNLLNKSQDICNQMDHLTQYITQYIIHIIILFKLTLLKNKFTNLFRQQIINYKLFFILFQYTTKSQICFVNKLQTILHNLFNYQLSNKFVLSINYKLLYILFQISTNSIILHKTIHLYFCLAIHSLNFDRYIIITFLYQHIVQNFFLSCQQSFAISKINQWINLQHSCLVQIFNQFTQYNTLERYAIVKNKNKFTISFIKK
eukprot:TRINITY_DN7586_c0_g1_i9.p2 TRINITY_DN7586_c0_g1~~TRINITY_DN7586_c0_g1_i9.p2  ORF type:complete len:284 (-),score=-43.76 TRINITY_DN7586_c0_g1_i9:461-1312(-)